MTKKLRRSKQRSRMLELLRRTDKHPTATWLYDELRAEFPTVSLGNVYRNLSILVEQGFVRKLDFGSTFDRYELADEQHAHFVCRNCNGIFDLPMPNFADYTGRMSSTEGHEFLSSRVEFFGLCRDCADGTGQTETDD